MPVLSVAIAVTMPRVSTACSLRTNAFLAAIRRMPSSKITVKVTGNPSGITETTKATANRNISSGGFPRSIPSSTVTAAIASVPTTS